MTHLSRQPKLSVLVQSFLRGEKTQMAQKTTEDSSSTLRAVQIRRKRLQRAAGELVYCLCFILIVAMVLFSPLIADWITGGK